MSIPATRVGTRPESALAPAPLPVRGARQRPGPATRTRSLLLGVVETAPGCARGFIRDALAQWGLHHLAEDAAAIASELVANDESGRGLLIVNALSHRWDWYPAVNGGKFVWAALLIRASPPSE